jgi:cytochrome c oxidase cbb3-type subunit 1
MSTAIAFLLAATFVISVGGLTLLIWALANDQFVMGEDAAQTIFAPGEVGMIEDPATPARARAAMQRERGAPGRATDMHELQIRELADRSSRTPVLWWLTSAIAWLLIGSVFGLIASIKLHLPEWLVSDAVMTFGRVRPASGSG